MRWKSWQFILLKLFSNITQTLFERFIFKERSLTNFQSNFLLSYGEKKSSKYLQPDLS